MDADWGVVLFGDVVRSRDQPQAATAWLERLCVDLDATYRESALASFEFTQGDEIQGLLRTDADPFQAVLGATLRPHLGTAAVPRMRWVLAAGPVDPGRGPATRRSGRAFLVARELLDQARADHDGLLCRTGDAEADELLSGTAPVLAAIIAGMTDRQREIASLALLEGLRQADIAERLGVARPTVSIAAARGDVRSLGRLAEAVRSIWSSGVARAWAAQRAVTRDTGTSAATS
jgi:hypothetical protein